MTLDDLLATWVPTQRWFGAKGRPIVTLTGEHEHEAVLSSPHVSLLPVVVTVTLGDGEVQRYQVPLSARPEPWEDLGHAFVGESDGTWYYDAPHDPGAAGLLLDALRESAHVGSVSFHRVGEVPEGLRSRLVGAEQSNTSLVYGEELIVKIFRRIAPGLNPDLELTRSLQDAGSPHVAPIHGWFQTTLDGTSTTLGIAQTFERSATEGWAMAQASVRDLYAELDLHADEVGGDFAAEAHRLGVATAEVHEVLRRVLPTSRADEAETLATCAQMRDRLDQAAAEVPELGPYVEGLQALYAGVATAGAVPTQRVHGDLHLGQVLRTGHGWLVLDFEGEPARPLSERTALMSPLRDVAGMLRSFEYAARSLLADHASAKALEYRAGEWADRNRSAFCDGYAEVAGRDPRDDSLLLKAFEADKAVYEVLYEARNRPTWLSIPMASLEKLAS
jgi:maltokinase